jgi:hypothetical protein
MTSLSREERYRRMVQKQRLVIWGFHDWLDVPGSCGVNGQEKVMEESPKWRIRIRSRKTSSLFQMASRK